MKILFLSHEGEGVWFVAKLLRGGHEVDWALGDDRFTDTLQGIVPPPLDKEADPEKYDLIVFDFSGSGDLADNLVEVTPVIGNNKFGDILEHDRLKGIEFMEMCGISVPKYESFDDIGKAAKWITDLGGKAVFKPFGGKANKASTYVANSPEDMIHQMEVLVPKLKGNSFLLQEFVEGTEVSTEGWFNGDDFYAINHDLEEKKFMSGGLGPNTGCSGNVVWMSGRDKLFEQTLSGCRDMLRKVSYRGPIDLNAIVTKDKAYGLEWTPRFGYEGLCNIIPILPVEFGQFLYQIAAGEAVDDNPKEGFVATVLVSVPPYPNPGNRALYEGVPVRGIDPEDLDHFYLSDVRVTDDGELETIGVDGMIGTPICTGSTLAEAFAECQKMIDRLEVPNLQYRNDIEEYCQKRYDELKANGWLEMSDDAE